MNKRLLMPKVYLIFMLLLCLHCDLFAQGRTVTGRVTDARDGSPLAGVTVQPKGSRTGGVTTGTDGRFSLQVASDVKALIFSSVGYVIQERPIGEGAMEVTLTASASNLNEIVVIGYGTARKKDLTGAVAIVSEKDFQKGVITTPEQMIAGKVPGVSIISNGGQPGAGSTIRIRGGASLNASNDPLIVIDGVPMDNEIPVVPGQKSAIPGAGNPLSFINPNDIESFTVLKDASAAAIYGTRASNGVIIITTKKGKGGAVKVNVSSVNSVATLVKKVSVLSAAEFRSIVTANATPDKVALLGAANTDWQDEIYQTALGTNNNISLSGGLGKLPYRISVGYQNQNGILRTDNLSKTSLALVLNPVLFDNHLKIDLNLKGSRQDTRFANQSAIGAAVSFDPTQPVKSKSSRYGGYYEWLDPDNPTGLTNLAGRNPLGLLEQKFDRSHPERSIGNLQLDYSFHFLPELHANANIGYDVAKGEGASYVTDSAADTYVAGGTGGQNNPYKTTKANTLAEFFLSYAKDLKSIKSHFDVLAGYSFNNYQTKIYNYPTFFANGTKQPNSDPAFPMTQVEHTLISFFGRANYTFKDRYLLTATIRRDGSSRFAPENRWNNFPSVAFAWKVKEESFLKYVDAVSDLKLRLGYGVTGQQDGIGDYDFISYYYLSQANASYQFGDSTWYQGYRPSGFYAPRRWEQTATYNAAVDYGFLDNRIYGSVDFYLKKTTTLLNNVAQPAGSNFSAYITANVGDMENKGVEFSVNVQPIRTERLTWDIGFNITHNKNKITRLTVVPNDTNYIGFLSGAIAGGVGGQFTQINAVGSPKNTFYLLRQVYNSKGQPIEGVFEDKNGDGIINQLDLYKSKPADAQTYMGFSTNLTYRKWSAGLVMRASLGNYAYNNNYSQTGTLTQIIGNTVPNNASTSYLASQFKNNNSQQLLSDYYLQNASFLRMDNFNVGYNVGNIARAVRLRLNVSVQNVFVITKYKGLDPEIGEGTTKTPGIDNNLYPRPRTYNLGLNLDF